ncbi:MAG: hypothetical protein NVS2B16_27910 [Chloroflexota bacterium]
MRAEAVPLHTVFSQQQALGFIKCDTMEPGHWEALQAVRCANLPNEAESGHVTLEDAPGKAS